MFIKKWIFGIKKLDTPKVLSEKIYESKIESEDLTIIKYDDKNLEKLVIPDYINSNKVQNNKIMIQNIHYHKDEEVFVDNLSHNIVPEDFEHIKILGKGFFGKVSQVRYKKNGNIYAMKSLRKDKLKQAKQIEHTKSEKKVLEIVDHPFIVSLKFAFQTPSKLYLIMEYHSGGELFFLLKHCGRFNEKDAIFYFSQIVLVFEFLHSKKIVYRSLFNLF